MTKQTFCPSCGTDEPIEIFRGDGNCTWCANDAPMGIVDLAPVDGRKNNGAKPKYGEVKINRSIRLTPTAYAWLQSKGGPDYIEQQARK